MTETEMPAQGEPRVFQLDRVEDVSGVSGVGAVAWGCEFPDGVVALRWATEWPSSVVWYDRGMAAVEAVHGHQGRTRIVPLDAGPRPVDASAIKRQVCEYLIRLNHDWEKESGSPIVPPTAIDWLGNGITSAAVDAIIGPAGEL